MPSGWPRMHFACYGGWLMSTLPKLLTQGSALFLDFDGTLADLAPRPDAVEVPGDLARLLDSLETQGLVQRLAVAEDRRAKKILLCDTARPLIEQIETIANALRQELFEGVDEEEIKLCMRVHSRILANLEK